MAATDFDNVLVSAVYRDKTKAQRDGTNGADYLVSVRINSRVYVQRFRFEEDAVAFREMDVYRMVEELIF